MSCDKCKNKVDIEDLSCPYVIRKCPECNREIKIREAGEKGHGIKINAFIGTIVFPKVPTQPL